MQGLTSITPKTPALEELNCSFMPALKVVDASLFAECPELKELTLRGSEELQELTGLEHAQKLLRLRVSRCVKLKNLRWTGHPKKDVEVCPILRYADFHGCHALSDEEIFAFVGDAEIEADVNAQRPRQLARLTRRSSASAIKLPPSRPSGGLKKQLTRCGLSAFTRKAAAQRAR